MRKWTEKEKGVMRDFIRNHPNVKLKTTTIPSVLFGFFGDRTPEAVYHGWRRQKGLKRKPKIKKQGAYVFKELPEVLSTIGELIEEFIKEKIEREIYMERSPLKS